LGRVERTQLLAELLATDEARAAGTSIEGLAQARRRERLMSSPVASLFLSVANVLRTIYLLPKRIQQFVKRVEALEQRASAAASRIAALEQELASLQDAEPPAALPARRRSDAR
jgi:hypothetical protein